MNIEDRIEKAMILGIQDVARLMFWQSQQNVPVRSGNLKRSGFFMLLPDGAQFGYRADYAAKVEFGGKVPGGRTYYRKGLPGVVSTASIFAYNPNVNRALNAGGSRYMGPAINQYIKTGVWAFVFCRRCDLELNK